MVFWVSQVTLFICKTSADSSDGCEPGYEASSEVYRVFKGELSVGVLADE
jgi:hypothetical protein